jgi:hypothetical protein
MRLKSTPQFQVRSLASDDDRRAKAREDHNGRDGEKAGQTTVLVTLVEPLAGGTVSRRTSHKRLFRRSRLPFCSQRELYGVQGSSVHRTIADAFDVWRWES